MSKCNGKQINTCIKQWPTKKGNVNIRLLLDFYISEENKAVFLSLRIFSLTIKFYAKNATTCNPNFIYKLYINTISNIYLFSVILYLAYNFYSLTSSSFNKNLKEEIPIRFSIA
jgi:hypothetical protein